MCRRGERPSATADVQDAVACTDTKAAIDERPPPKVKHARASFPGRRRLCGCPLRRTQRSFVTTGRLSLSGGRCQQPATLVIARRRRNASSDTRVIFTVNERLDADVIVVGAGPAGA